MSRVNPVTLAQARERLEAYRRTNGAGPHPAASLADVIWPDGEFLSRQGAGAAATRVLKRLGCYWVCRNVEGSKITGWIISFPSTPIQTDSEGSLPRRVRRIVTSGDNRQVDHRADFRHCPGCDHAIENEEWDKAAVTLVTEPACYKAGCVAVISECPKCFALSWVHHRMATFGWNDAWPDDWKVAVKERESAVKVDALREWGAGICCSCRHLTGGSVEYHAWRHCIIGVGPPEQACDKYAAINSRTK